MPLSTAQIIAAINQLNTDVGLLHDIVHGDATDVVATDAGNVDSILKFYADVLAQISAVSLSAGVITGEAVTVTAAGTASNADTGKIAELGGNNLYTWVYANASGYPAKYVQVIRNIDTVRWKRIQYTDGRGVFKEWLGPGQVTTIRKANDGNWRTANFQPWHAQASATFFFAPTGTGSLDADGSVSTSPITIAGLHDRMKREIHLNYQSTILQAADGAYTTEMVLVGQVQGNHVFAVHGNVGNPNLTVVNPGTGETGLYLKDYACAQFQHFAFVGGPTSSLAVADQLAILVIGNCSFGQTLGGTQLAAISNGCVGIDHALTFIGDAGQALYSDAGHITIGPFAHQLASPLAYSGYFAVASNGGKIVANPGASFAGAGVAGTVGVRALSNALAVINVGGSSFFPGSSAPVELNGGRYF